MAVQHALDGDKRTCRCGEPWPLCDGWWAQQRDMVMDYAGRLALLATYRDVPPDTMARLEAEWDRRSKCSTWI